MDSIDYAQELKRLSLLMAQAKEERNLSAYYNYLRKKEELSDKRRLSKK